MEKELSGEGWNKIEQDMGSYLENSAEKFLVLRGKKGVFKNVLKKNYARFLNTILDGGVEGIPGHQDIIKKSIAQANDIHLVPSRTKVYIFDLIHFYCKNIEVLIDNVYVYIEQNRGNLHIDNSEILQKDIVVQKISNIKNKFCKRFFENVENWENLEKIDCGILETDWYNLYYENNLENQLCESLHEMIFSDAENVSDAFISSEEDVNVEAQYIKFLINKKPEDSKIVEQYENINEERKKNFNELPSFMRSKNTFVFSPRKQRYYVEKFMPIVIDDEILKKDIVQILNLHSLAYFCYGVHDGFPRFTLRESLQIADDVYDVVRIEGMGVFRPVSSQMKFFPMQDFMTKRLSSPRVNAESRDFPYGYITHNINQENENIYTLDQALLGMQNVFIAQERFEEDPEIIVPVIGGCYKYANENSNNTECGGLVLFENSQNLFENTLNDSFYNLLQQLAYSFFDENVCQRNITKLQQEVCNTFLNFGKNLKKIHKYGVNSNHDFSNIEAKTGRVHVQTHFSSFFMLNQRNSEGEYLKILNDILLQISYIFDIFHSFLLEVNENISTTSYREYCKLRNKMITKFANTIFDGEHNILSAFFEGYFEETLSERVLDDLKRTLIDLMLEKELLLKFNSIIFQKTYENFEEEHKKFVDFIQDSNTINTLNWFLLFLKDYSHSKANNFIKELKSKNVKSSLDFKNFVDNVCYENYKNHLPDIIYSLIKNKIVVRIFPILFTFTKKIREDVQQNFHKFLLENELGLEECKKILIKLLQSFTENDIEKLIDTLKIGKWIDEECREKLHTTSCLQEKKKIMENLIEKNANMEESDMYMILKIFITPSKSIFNEVLSNFNQTYVHQILATFKELQLK